MVSQQESVKHSCASGEQDRMALLNSHLTQFGVTHPCDHCRQENAVCEQ